jgi:hypothetical protein
MYFLYIKSPTESLYTNRPKTEILSNESLSELFQLFSKTSTIQSTPPSQIELWKDQHSICELSHIVHIKFGDHILCLARDLIGHEFDYHHKHPNIPEDQIYYTDYNERRYLEYYNDERNWIIYNLVPNRIEIVSHNNTNTILIHDDVPCGFPITYIYKFQKYLIRVTDAPFDAPFISTTNNIMCSVEFFMDDLSPPRHSSCVPMLFSGHRTKVVFTDTIMLNFLDYLIYIINGIVYE